MNYQFIARLAQADGMVVTVVLERGLLTLPELNELAKLLKLRGHSEGRRREVETALRAAEKRLDEAEGIVRRR